MKKMLALLLAIVVAASLTACGGSGGAPAQSAAPAENSIPAQEPASQPVQEAAQASGGTVTANVGQQVEESAAPFLDFTLYNSTGLDLYYVYISASDDTAWGEDVLGDSILYDGGYLDVSFTPGVSSIYWDIKVQDSYGDEYALTGFDLSTLSSVTLYYDGSTDTMWAE